MKGMKVFVLTVAVMLLAGAAWSAELVGYWAFDENQGAIAKNSAISGYNGEINGAKWVPGKIGSALEFNGAGDFVEVKDDAANSPFALTSMSISAWIKPSAYPSGSEYTVRLAKAGRWRRLITEVGRIMRSVLTNGTTWQSPTIMQKSGSSWTASWIPCIRRAASRGLAGRAFS